VPVFVDGSADPAAAAEALAYSKAFDNSILCTNESTLIAEASIAPRLVAELERRHVAVLDAEQTDRIRATCYPDGHVSTELAGRDAVALAEAAQISVPAHTKVLVAPFEVIVGEEPLAQEKLFPLLGMVTVPDARRGVEAARALLRIGGAGHSAVIHSQHPETILAFGAAMPVLRVTVNAPGSTGSSGLDTNLSIAMTIGTGFFGRSALTENLEPRHLVQWTRLAYAVDAPFHEFAGLQPWTAEPAATAGGTTASTVPAPSGPDERALRDELRRLILEELREAVRN
jgi:acyl-CoA reductase-like NAD-dependent aldehyde dehydrogenase